MQHLESEQWTAAIGSFEESLQLDPDFKVPCFVRVPLQPSWLAVPRVSCSLVFPIPIEEVLKAPWINMAVAFLRLRQWQQVLEVWILRIQIGFFIGKTIDLSWEEVENNHGILVMLMG